MTRFRRQLSPSCSVASAQNNYIAYPYTKQLTAFPFVDQSGAVIVTTAAWAQAHNIPRDRWVFYRGGAAHTEVWFVTERPTLHANHAIAVALCGALCDAGFLSELELPAAIDVACRGFTDSIEQSEHYSNFNKSALQFAPLQRALSHIDAFDLYSCFPSAVQYALSSLGLDPRDPRPISLTGGLSAFGGAGSTYMLHSIAAATRAIRTRQHRTVLVSGVANYCTRYCVGIYSAEPGPWMLLPPQRHVQHQQSLDEREPVSLEPRAESSAIIESFTAIYDGGAPQLVVLGRLPNSKRFLAYASCTLEQLANAVGKPCIVRYDEKAQRNIATISNAKL
jgi:acetyl-CoA C-acetyltransferase